MLVYSDFIHRLIGVAIFFTVFFNYPFLYVLHKNLQIFNLPFNIVGIYSIWLFCIALIFFTSFIGDKANKDAE